MNKVLESKSVTFLQFRTRLNFCIVFYHGSQLFGDIAFVSKTFLRRRCRCYESGRRESRALFVLVSVILVCFLHRVPGITERIPAQPQLP